ncbi:MAG: protein translocase subunit SecD [candidate division Zixibacteria bacterium]|nr:protein translocase subunit SecD [candidate division Zixibacteria bacterium]
MGKSQGWKIGLILFFLIVAIYYIYPSVKYHAMSYEEKMAMQVEDPAEFQALQNKALKLGLDLQGGMHMVLQVDKSQLTPEEAKDAPERVLQIIRNRIDQWGVSEPLIAEQGENRIVVELPGLRETERAKELIGKTAVLEFKLLAEPGILGETLDAIDSVLAAKIDADEGIGAEEEESQEVVDSLVPDAADLFAESEAEIPGAVEEDDYFKEKPFTALLDEIGGSAVSVADQEYPTLKKYLNDPDVQAVIPDDIELAWSTRTRTVGSLRYHDLYALKSKVEMTGKYLTDARPNFDQFRKPVVNFQLTKEGGRIFAAVTGANIGKPLAITLDGRVESAPEIKSKIRDKGQITMGGNATFEEATDLAVVLRAGALPAPVQIIQNSVVGATLGQDSIEKGRFSALLAFILVMVFILIYYRVSGFVADLALILNVLFLLACMAGLHATLTMPGIAGIILTVGMSIDANVLIFERIREELRTGKTVKASIDAGYNRAWLTILDSRITLLITALFLFMLGTGPIKGFAVTLALGIVISIFTAFFTTKVIFDMRKGYKSLSI